MITIDQFGYVNIKENIGSDKINAFFDLWERTSYVELGAPLAVFYDTGRDEKMVPTFINSISEG